MPLIIKKYLLPIINFLLFEIISVSLWLIVDHIFFLFNFTYIGFFTSLGIFLLIKQYKNARIIIELFVGLYTLVYLGIINRKNMQFGGCIHGFYRITDKN